MTLSIEARRAQVARAFRSNVRAFERVTGSKRLPVTALTVEAPQAPLVKLPASLFSLTYANRAGRLTTTGDVYRRRRAT